jgi:hypothetical protein
LSPGRLKGLVDIVQSYAIIQNYLRSTEAVEKGGGLVPTSPGIIAPRHYQAIGQMPPVASSVARAGAWFGEMPEKPLKAWETAMLTMGEQAGQVAVQLKKTEEDIAGIDWARAFWKFLPGAKHKELGIDKMSLRIAQTMEPVIGAETLLDASAGMPGAEFSAPLMKARYQRMFTDMHRAQLHGRIVGPELDELGRFHRRAAMTKETIHSFITREQAKKLPEMPGDLLGELSKDLSPSQLDFLSGTPTPEPPPAGGGIELGASALLPAMAPMLGAGLAAPWIQRAMKRDGGDGKLKLSRAAQDIATSPEAKAYTEVAAKRGEGELELAKLAIRNIQMGVHVGEIVAGTGKEILEVLKGMFQENRFNNFIDFVERYNEEAVGTAPGERDTWRPMPGRRGGGFASSGFPDPGGSSRPPEPGGGGPPEGRSPGGAGRTPGAGGGTGPPPPDEGLESGSGKDKSGGGRRTPPGTRDPFYAPEGKWPMGGFTEQGTPRGKFVDQDWYEDRYGRTPWED